VPTVSFWKTSTGVLVIIILLIVGFAGLGMLTDRPSETSATPPPVVAKKPPTAPYNVGQKVIVSGEENGELVVPRPNIWKKPGGRGLPGQGLAGNIGSGTPVSIKGSRYVSGRWFFLIETKNKGRSGWISESFLKP